MYILILVVVLLTYSKGAESNRYFRRFYQADHLLLAWKCRGAMVRKSHVQVLYRLDFAHGFLVSDHILFYPQPRKSQARGWKQEIKMSGDSMRPVRERGNWLKIRIWSILGEDSLIEAPSFQP